MKDFMKMTGATIVGLLLFTIVLSIISIIGLAGVVASEGSSYTAPENSILRINLTGEISERDEQSPLNALIGGGSEVLALDQLLTAIEKAAKTDDVKGIYLEGGSLTGSPAMLEELRQALTEFKKSGKFITAYGDTYSGGSYYVCSVADQLLLNPSGIIDWHGLASQPIFYTEAMAKLGVKMQVFKVGTFKSAVEPFINTEMSEANREQTNSYLSSIWNAWLKDVAASRKVSVEHLNQMADTLTAFMQPTLLVKEKMADKLCYRDEVKDILKKKLGLEEDDHIDFVPYKSMSHAVMDIEKHSDRIAVYYAYGDIVDEMPSSLQGAEPSIVTDPVITDLNKLMKDDDVKAVVIRVNSGGGSAFASEQIWHQVQLLKAKKPVVISMGGLAASGGYYISCGANKIFAEPTTLTGSIGIFGMFPDASELLTDKVGLHFDVVKTNKYADFGSYGRAINDEEGQKLQVHINNGYDLFTRRVAEGRGISQDSVKVIGEGRVWTGEQAKKIGLVDELGNLQDAIKAAAKLAKTNEYNIATYPETKGMFDGILGGDDTYDFMNAKIKLLLGDYYGAYHTIQQLGVWNPIQARLPYEIVIK